MKDTDDKNHGIPNDKMIIPSLSQQGLDVIIPSAPMIGNNMMDGLTNSNGPVVLNSLTFEDRAQLVIVNDLELIVSKLVVGKKVKIIGYSRNAKYGEKYSSSPNRRTHPGEHGFNGGIGRKGQNGAPGTNIRIKAGDFIYESLTVITTGGSGGHGGQGQNGGKGANAQCPFSDAGHGGSGGHGGQGGSGGHAGKLLISFNTINGSKKSPEKQGLSWIASGGKGGESGEGGFGGEGGNSSNCGINHLKGGDRGKTGDIGTKGRNGNSYDPSVEEWLKFN